MPSIFWHEKLRDKLHEHPHSGYVKMKANCAKCQGVRNHEILGEHHTSEETSNQYYIDIWRMLRCCGCENIVFTHTHKVVSKEDSETKLSRTTYHPAIYPRPRIAWINFFCDLPEEVTIIDDLYSQTCSAIAEKSWALSALGLRAILECAATWAAGNLSSFPAKIDALCAKGVLNDKQAQTVQVSFDMGCAVAHRGYIPRDEDVFLAMDAVEMLLRILFFNPAETESRVRVASTISKRIPPRPKTTKALPPSVSTSSSPDGTE